MPWTGQESVTKAAERKMSLSITIVKIYKSMNILRNLMV